MQKYLLNVWGTYNKGKEDFFHQEYKKAKNKKMAIEKLKKDYEQSKFKIDDIKVIEMKDYMWKIWME